MLIKALALAVAAPGVARSITTAVDPRSARRRRRARSPAGVVAGGEARGGGEVEPAGWVLAGGVVGPRDGIQEKMDLHFCLAVPSRYKTR